MVLHCQFHPMILGNFHRLFEHLRQGSHLRSMQFVAEHQAAPHHAHHTCADQHSIGDARHHLFVGGPVLAALETIWMTPGVHFSKETVVAVTIDSDFHCVCLLYSYFRLNPISPDLLPLNKSRRSNYSLGWQLIDTCHYRITLL